MSRWKKIFSNVCPYFISKILVRTFFPFFFFHIMENLTQSTGTQQDSWKIGKIPTFWKLHHSPIILLPHPIWLQEFLKHGIFKQLKEQMFININNTNRDSSSQYWAHPTHKQNIAAFTQVVLLKHYLVHHIGVLCWYIKWHIKIWYGLFCD